MAQPTWHACLERNLPAPSKTYFDSFGLPLTVLCQTTGKLVLLAKFWVTAIWQREKRWWWKPISKPNTVVSMLRTTCHMPPGTKIVSPGCWMHSTGAYLNKFWVGIPTKWNLHYTMLIIKKVLEIMFWSKWTGNGPGVYGPGVYGPGIYGPMLEYMWNH